MLDSSSSPSCTYSKKGTSLGATNKNLCVGRSVALVLKGNNVAMNAFCMG